MVSTSCQLSPVRTLLLFPPSVLCHPVLEKLNPSVQHPSFFLLRSLLEILFLELTQPGSQRCYPSVMSCQSPPIFLFPYPMFLVSMPCPSGLRRYDHQPPPLPYPPPFPKPRADHFPNFFAPQMPEMCGLPRLYLCFSLTL